MNEVGTKRRKKGIAYHIYNARTGEKVWDRAAYSVDICNNGEIIYLPTSHAASGSKFVLLYKQKQRGPVLGLAVDLETGAERIFNVGVAPVVNVRVELHLGGLFEER